MIFFWIAFTVFICISIGAILYGLPYVPTLSRDINKLFEKLDIGEGDYVIDLGAGDGRILLKSAENRARSEGVEINPFLVAVSRFRLRKYRELARVYTGDLFAYKIPDEATHIFLFTNARFMKKLETKIIEKSKKGKGLTVISYGFEFSNLNKSKKSFGPFLIYEL